MNTIKAPPRTSLRGLRTFCIAARYESFRVAADELFITSSAVSHQIKSLEQELGLRLFERGTRELKLTPQGQLLFEDLSPLIKQLDDTVTRHRSSVQRRSVRISVQPFFASEFFVPRLSEFTASYPDIDIHVGTSDETADKHPGDADLSIRLFKSPPKELRSDLLFPLRMVPAGSPAFKKSIRRSKGRVTSPFPIVIHETRPKAWRNWSKSSGIQLPEDSKVTRLDSMIAIVRAAEQGIGAALVPMPIAKLWFEQGSIVRLFNDELIADSSYFLVSSSESGDQGEVEALRTWILETFAE